MSVKLTERAAEEFKTACNSKSLPVESTRLRVHAERSEEQGKLLISLKFDDRAPRQDDLVEDTAGAQLVINEALADALGETLLDFKEDGGGFVLERISA